MQRLFLRVLAVSTVLVLTAPVSDSEAGHRRALRRAKQYKTYVQPKQVQRIQVQAAQVKPNTVNKEPFVFPDICPRTPLYPVSGDIWVWSAYRHYGEGLNCSNCYIEPTSLTGDYAVGSLNWPYPCGDEMCEPDTAVRSRAVAYQGVKGGLPVDFNYSPVSEIPRQAMAQEILPRTYFSFNDQSAARRPRYFIAYHIKTAREQFTIAHEVDRALLERERVSIHALRDEEMKPVDQFGDVSDDHSFVYLHKPEGKLSDIVFYLKR